MTAKKDVKTEAPAKRVPGLLECRHCNVTVPSYSDDKEKWPKHRCRGAKSDIKPFTRFRVLEPKATTVDTAKFMKEFGRGYHK